MREDESVWKENQILKIKKQNCGAASRGILISEFSARELGLKWGFCGLKGDILSIFSLTNRLGYVYNWILFGGYC